MPLFGSSKKHDNNTSSLDNMDANNTMGGGRGHHVHPTDQTALNDYPGQASGGGMGNMNTFGHAQNSGPGHANYDNNFQSGQGQYGHLGLGGGQPVAQNDPYSAGGVGSGHQGGGRGIPPAGAIDHGTTQTGSGGNQGSGNRLTGKIESAVGSLVGSDALKAKGLQKEQESNSIKIQGSELAEAERLEREAMMRRQRAVGHGADPQNNTLGAGNVATGTGHGPGIL